MIRWLVAAILVAVASALAIIDKRQFGTWLSPVSLFALPFTAVAILALLLAQPLGFIPLGTNAIIVWIVGMLLFRLGGLPFDVLATARIHAGGSVRRPMHFEAVSERLAIVLGWCCIPVVGLHFLSSLRAVGGLPGLGTEDFAYYYGAGIAAHLLALCTALFILLVGTVTRDKKVAILTILALGFLIMIRQAKYSVILPLLSGLLYRALTGRTRLTIGKIGGFVAAVFVLFCLAYLIGFWAVNPSSLKALSTYLFLPHHFLAYTFAGVLPLGPLITEGPATIHGDPRVTFAPFYNLWATVSGIPLVDLGNEYSALIVSSGSEQSNVATIFGPLLIGLGYAGTATYTVLLGTASYGSFAAATITRNAWLMVLWLGIAAMLAFSWYSLWFELLSAYEVPAFCLMFAALLSLARNAAARSQASRPVVVAS